MAYNISQFLDAENKGYSFRGNKEQACTCAYNQAQYLGNCEATFKIKICY